MGSNSGIKLDIKGFEKLLERVQEAEGDIESATTQALSESAAAVAAELRSAASAAGVPGSVTSGITQDAPKWEGNKCSVSVGWKVGSYDPRNLSQGFKAIFLNYGTPHRTQHGKVQGKRFIAAAKSAATSKARSAQKKAFNDILKGLK